MNRQRRGILIVFEGIDGTGKSTQLHLLADFLRKGGYRVVTTREPTEGRYGRQIRALYQNRESVTREQELDLFLADRREHVQQLIAPELARGSIVLCDRYFLSTAAYQGAAGFEPQEIIERNSFAPPPDIALLFELDIARSLHRITAQRGDRLDDFEQLESLAEVDRIFRGMQAPYISRIEASGSIDAIEQSVQSVVMAVLERSGLEPAPDKTEVSI